MGKIGSKDKGGAGAVGAVHHGDGLGGQLDVGVELRDAGNH